MRPDARKWKEAEEREMATLNSKGTFALVDAPANLSPLPCKWVYKLKVKDGDFAGARYKARLVVCGNLMLETEFGNTYAPTARMWVVRMLCSIAAQTGLLIRGFDLISAFTVANQPEEFPVHVTIPDYEVPPHQALRMVRNLYGTRSAGALYFAEINTFLIAYGFKPVSTDETLYRLDRDDHFILLSLYVDDGFVVTDSDSLYRTFLEALSLKYELNDTGEMNWHLGISITRDLEAGTIKLDQHSYSESMLRRFGMEDCTPKSSPMRAHLRLSKDDCPAFPDKKTVKLYQQIIGSLLYLSSGTRPELSYPVAQCAQYMTNPGPSHMEAVKHILRYIKGTSDVGITYGQASPGMENVLFSFVDADHAACTDDRKSVAGYALMLNSAAICWSSKKMKTISLSSFESEWMAASIAGCEIEVVRRTLEEIGYAQTSPTTCFEDNAATIYSSDPARPMSTRSRHIELRIFKLRDLTRDGIIRLVKVATDRQIADCLTKALPAAAVAAAREYLCGNAKFSY